MRLAAPEAGLSGVVLSREDGAHAPVDAKLPIRVLEMRVDGSFAYPESGRDLLRSGIPRDEREDLDLAGRKTRWRSPEDLIVVRRGVESIPNDQLLPARDGADGREERNRVGPFVDVSVGAARNSQRAGARGVVQAEKDHPRR